MTKEEFDKEFDTLLDQETKNETRLPLLIKKIIKEKEYMDVIEQKKTKEELSVLYNSIIKKLEDEKEHYFELIDLFKLFKNKDSDISINIFKNSIIKIDENKKIIENKFKKYNFN